MEAPVPEGQGMAAPSSDGDGGRVATFELAFSGALPIEAPDEAEAKYALQLLWGQPVPDFVHQQLYVRRPSPSCHA